MLIPVFGAFLCGSAVLAWPGVPRRRASRDSTWGQIGRLSSLWRRCRAPAERTSGGLPADLVMELLACGLRGGLPVPDAISAAARASRRDRLVATSYLDDVLGRLRLGLTAQQAWAAPPPEFVPLARAMLLAQLSGAPAAGVVSRAADDCRAARRERVEQAAARLGVRLVLPLGLAVLPGFVLLAVVPIVLGLAASVLQGGA